MGLLLTLDPARRTGWCLCEPFSGRPRMRCGSWELPQSGTIQERIEHLAAHLTKLTGEERIEYVGIEIPISDIHSKDVIEETDFGPMKRRKVFGSVKSIAQLWAYHGAIISIVSELGIPYRAEAVRTWRAAVWKGGGNMRKPDAIEKCRSLCHRFEVHAPNDDARTAVAMMFWLNGNLRVFRAEDEIRARQAA